MRRVGMNVWRPLGARAMANTPNRTDAPPELRPDGWERFERAIDAAAKHGPIHRKAKPKAESSPAKRPRDK